MKIAILGDTHFGVRADSLDFHNSFDKFYNEFFFPYLKENNIDTIIQLGDLFDRRKYITFNSLHLARNYFFDKLKLNNLKLYSIVGNHDIAFKNTLTVNSPKLLLNEYDNICVYDKFTTTTFDNLDIDFVPWICEENSSDIFDNINKSKSKVCMGHLEINGCNMGHTICEHGYDPVLFNKYYLVVSGHFHTKSKTNNIIYTGTPYEMDWTDYCIDKGFYIFDTQTLDLEFVKNPQNMFMRIDYDDTKQTLEEIQAFDYSNIKDKYVKIVVFQKNNPYTFDMFIDKLHQIGALDIKVVEDFEVELEQTTEAINQAEDTLTIINKVIDSSIDNYKFIESNKIKQLIKELYMESINTN